MKLMKIILVVVVSLLNCNSFAFDWEKCRKIASRGNGLGFFISTSSYLSSTSECSMLGRIEHDQKLFIAQAYEPLQIDIARGGGEFADAFAEISQCNSHGKIVLKKELQKNFAKIYGNMSNEDVEKTHLRLADVMKADRVIVRNCKLI